MTGDQAGGVLWWRRRSRSTWLAPTGIAVGLVLVAVAVAAQVSAPQSPRSAGRINGGPGPRPPSAAAPVGPESTPLGVSRPVSIRIPAIGVRSQVLPIGLAKDGSLAVPQPGPNLDKAAWFRNSPTPGQPGPSIIEGHVDSSAGPSVFFTLGAVRPGDRVHVTRADGTEVVFTVDAVRDYPKSGFPTATVYGAKDLGTPALRLITCSDFNARTRHHTGNEVVFAHLTATHRPASSRTRGST
jgi:sortase (surface protein transpeptidase)